LDKFNEFQKWTNSKQIDDKLFLYPKVLEEKIEKDMEKLHEQFGFYRTKMEVKPKESRGMESSGRIR